MGKKHVMVPAEEVDMSTVKYKLEIIKAPHVSGRAVKYLVKFLETPLFGSLFVHHLRKQNGMDQILRNTVIPETPMFRPEYPPQEPETGVIHVDEDGKPEGRVEVALQCLPKYDPSSCESKNSTSPFRYWRIRDYAHAYRSKITTPSMVAEKVISVFEDFQSKTPPEPLLIAFNVEDVRKQSAASTQRFEEGRPLSILDGIFMAIKDDIDCYPYISKGGTTWMHEVRSFSKDAICVSKLRSCGLIFVGKANMHELGMGTTGNNANHGTTRNPHAADRYTGGSSSGPAAIVAAGICSAALGTDAAGSVRIPSSLCGVVGLKTTYRRTDIRGSLYESGTVEVIGPIASNVEDIILIYSVIAGSSATERISMRPSPACLPNLSSVNSLNALGSIRLGKYSEWFNDVQSNEISARCNYALSLLSRAHGCEIVDIKIPELHEMHMCHIVSIGSAILASLNPSLLDGKGPQLAYDSRVNMALFQSFTATDYLASQSLRRRLMHYHMEIFKKVDFIVTPTTGMAAPLIPRNAIKYGETDLQVSTNLMRFILAGNFLGLPAISIPVGYDKQGLPIGLQLIGRPWGEASILRLASAVEELYSESIRRPASYYDVLKMS